MRQEGLADKATAQNSPSDTYGDDAPLYARFATMRPFALRTEAEIMELGPDEELPSGRVRDILIERGVASRRAPDAEPSDD
jgi:hypothetical protein